MKKKTSIKVLLDSGCTRTCIDEDYVCSLGWPMRRIPNPIQVKYIDGMITEAATIWYSVNVQI
jgi:hypothetical protein